MPGLSLPHKRCILTYLHSMDLDCTGHVSFRRLMQYMSRSPAALLRAATAALAAEAVPAGGEVQHCFYVKTCFNEYISLSFDDGRPTSFQSKNILRALLGLR